ncbi:MAG: HAD hydrolase-like protein [SAR324 cluster bacterium]|nr:HAD hydrolase-like protein [SAR324 cluster bacterium]
MHILFDLDGTLTDPKEGIIACIRFALSTLEFEVDRNTQFESFIGPPLHDSFQKLFRNDELTKKAVEVFRKRYSSIGLFENLVYDGIEECLASMHEKGCSKFIVTSKPAVFANRIIEHFKLKKYFKFVYGSNLDGSLADKTKLLEHVLESEKMAPHEAIMVGDRKFDVMGAKNHGIKAIGVSWGYGTEQELQEAGADRICHHPSELYESIFQEMQSE